MGFLLLHSACPAMDSLPALEPNKQNPRNRQEAWLIFLDKRGACGGGGPTVCQDPPQRLDPHEQRVTLLPKVPMGLAR